MYHTNYFHAKEKVNLLFKALRKKGYVARQNFSCCTGCACYELADYFQKKGIMKDSDRKVVYYHHQSADTFKETANLMLGWQGIGKEIVDEAHKLDIVCDWDGSEDTKIKLVFALKEFA